MMREVICLMGPTASGKTDLAVTLTSVLPFEIISVDSAMVYRGMDIGTAKPDLATLLKAPHHLIDICDPTEAFSAAAFCEAADKLCDAIFARGRIPLLVGGTMMYFRAFQEGLSDLPSANPSVRKELLATAKTKGWAYLHAQLSTVDPVTARRVHPNDTQRIQRALEVDYTTQKPLSFHFLQAKEQRSAKYRFVNLS